MSDKVFMRDLFRKLQNMLVNIIRKKNITWNCFLHE